MGRKSSASCEWTRHVEHGVDAVVWHELVSPTRCSPTLDAMLQPRAQSDDVVESLLLASRALVGVAARSLVDVDVTLPQFRALVLISSRSRTTVSELGAALGIHSTSATRLCDRLVRKRLIRRSGAAEDRRETELHLAAGGRRLVERVTDRRRRDLAEIVARLGIDDTRAVAQLLESFAAAADDSVLEADLFGWMPPGSGGC